MRGLEDSKHRAIVLDECDSSSLDDVEVVPAEPCLYPIAEPVYEIDEVITTPRMAEEKLSRIPLVSATPLCEPLHFVSHVEVATSAECNCTQPNDPCELELDPPIGTRPEFLFASVLLHEPTTTTTTTSLDDLGLVLENRSRGGVRIAGIMQNSPFRGTYIRPGDHIVAVNNLRCSDLSIARIEELFRASRDTLSICVHNAKGDPQLVSSSVMKPHPTSRVGLTLKRRNDVIRIKELGEHSLFCDTLLTPKQRCLWINGIPCEQLTAHAASDLIGAAKRRVTIVSQIQASCAVTIARYERVAWWRKVAKSAGFVSHV